MSEQYSALPAAEDLADEDLVWGTESEAPLISPSHCHSLCSSEIVNRCAVCSNRQQRSRLIWAVCLVWAIPLALAAGRCYGLWGVEPHTTRQQPQGQLQLVQVVFRHGARTPLSNLYWPNTTQWTHCSQHPLQGPAQPGASDSNTASTNGISLKLYDPSGAAEPPALSGDEEPTLPGGCRMGSLTDAGFQNALDLGSELRQRYIHQHALLPSHHLDLSSLHAESTAVQRTVTTLRGVLNGLYPNSSAVVPVAVRPFEQELMSADWDGCPLLANLTSELTALQQERDAQDARLQELVREVRAGLLLPEDAPLLWNRLRDELACMAAEGTTPAAAAAQSHLLTRIDYVTTEHKVETSAPEPGHCLLGKDHQQQCLTVTALTTGRLLNQLLHNMLATATSTSGANRTQPTGSNSTTDQPHAAGRSSRKLLLAGTGTPKQAIATSRDGDAAGDQHSQKATGPKLMLFSAHDTTLLPLLTALGQHQSSWPGFASHIAFELWGHKGKYSVRVLHDGQPLRLPLAPKDSNLRSRVVSLFDWATSASMDWVQRTCGQLLRAVVPYRRQQGTTGLGSGSGRAPLEGASSSASSGGAPASPSPSTHLSSNGEGAITQAQYVVGLQDFQQRVIQDYVLSGKDYAHSCGGVGPSARSSGSRVTYDSWRAQFY